MQVTIRKSITDDVCTIGIAGVLDYSTIDLCEDQILDMPDEAKRIIIDFAELEFTDSTGIGAIINLIYLAKEKNIDIEFLSLNEEIADVFETVGVFRIIAAFKEEEARHAPNAPYRE